MTPDRDEILRALERVIDPELRKPVTELDMVRDVVIDGNAVSVTIALTVAGCPLRSSFQDQVAEHVGSLPNVERVELRFDVMSAGGEGRADDEAPRRPAGEVDLARPANTRDRRRERQGRRRQVVADGQPGCGARRARPAGRPDRRGRVRPLAPAHARRPPAADRRRQDDRPSRSRADEVHLDRQLHGRQRARDVARADAPPCARAVPLRRALGRARHRAHRHASGNRRHGDLARASCCRAPRCSS